MDTIYDLISDVKNNNQVALNSLKSKYAPLLISSSKSFEKTGAGSYDDLYYIAESAFIKAIFTYDSTKNPNFGSYAKTLVHRSLISAYRKSKKKVRTPKPKKERQKQIDFSAFEGMTEEEIINKVTSVLSNFETLVFEYVLEGLKPSQIAKIINKDAKSVSNAIFRIRSKILIIK